MPVDVVLQDGAMTLRAMMDDRPSSRSAPGPGTPPSGPAGPTCPSASPPAAPSPGKQPQDAPATSPMLATMTNVNVDGYLYEQHEQHQPHPSSVIYSTASLDHTGLPVAVGVHGGELIDGGGAPVVYQHEVSNSNIIIINQICDDMSPVIHLR